MNGIGKNCLFSRGSAVPAIALLLSVCMLVSTASQAAVLRVDAASTASVPDGQSWATAYPAIQPAADAAAPDDEVWVAKGTYTGTELQVANLKAVISLYGGFTGTESARNQRDWKSNPTVIDGEGARQCVSAYFAPIAEVNGFTLRNGMSEYGAGMHYGTATNCTFTNNAATKEGGGVYFGRVVNCSFAGNLAEGNGGGMNIGDAVNCTFIGNTSHTRGGGMYYGTATNCTFFRNSASFEGGGMYYGKAVNSIIWGNSTSDILNTEVTHCCLPQATAGTGNIFGNPGFVNPWADDLRLRADSPCVDAAVAYLAPATDLPGRVRPRGENPDMGAYEYYAGDDAGAADPVTVRVDAASTAANPDGLTWETAYATLQVAADASGGYGAEIWVAAGTYTAAAVPEVVKLVPGTSVYGGFAGTETARDQRDWARHLTIIDGQQARRGVTASDSSTIDGFTIRNGMAEQGGGMSYGAVANCTFTGNAATGIYCYGGAAFHCAATDCTFTGNSASGTYGEGGAMYFGTATGCTFTGNSTSGTNASGGGMSDGTATGCTFHANTSSGTAGGYGGGAIRTIATNCVFSENTALTGGGMYYGTADSCTFTGNTSATDGGGMFNGDAVNCVFAENMALVDAGGMRAGTATNCTFAGNSAVHEGGGVKFGTQSNCIFWQNTPDDTHSNYAYFSCLTSVPLDGWDNISGDPHFVDAAAGDYRLLPGSPCIDAGRSERAPRTDIVGMPRPQGLGKDMGAYELEATATVPDVSGLAQTVARQAVAAAQLRVRNASEEYDLTVPVGHVIRQNPPAGSKVVPQTPVDLVLSRGPLPVPVPGLVGQLQPAAEIAIRSAGFAVGAVTEQHSLTVPAGTVMAQTPMAGAEVSPGTPVNLVVSRGGIAAPNVAGQSQDAAAAALTGAGLVVGTVTRGYSLAVPMGSVISQSVAPGTPLLPGAAVNLVVSRGGIAVPAVTGQTQSAASAAISGASLAVGTVTQQYSTTAPPGTVISQTPAAGTEVLPGVPVALVTSRGAQPSVVPDVVGLPQAQAEAAIAGAGLALGTVTQAHSETVAAGIVLSQSPAAGAELSPGRVVGIVVSLGASAAEGEGEPASVTAQQLAGVYDTADTNGDGTLSFDESVAAVTGLTQAVFNTLDTNGDGQLASDELGVDDGAGCAGCQGGRKVFDPTRMGDLFLMALGAMGLAVMSTLRRP